MRLLQRLLIPWVLSLLIVANPCSANADPANQVTREQVAITLWHAESGQLTHTDAASLHYWLTHASTICEWGEEKPMLGDIAAEALEMTVGAEAFTPATGVQSVSAILSCRIKGELHRYHISVHSPSQLHQAQAFAQRYPDADLMRRLNRSGPTLLQAKNGNQEIIHLIKGLSHLQSVTQVQAENNIQLLAYTIWAKGSRPHSAFVVYRPNEQGGEILKQMEFPEAYSTTVDLVFDFNRDAAPIAIVRLNYGAAAQEALIFKVSSSGVVLIQKLEAGHFDFPPDKMAPGLIASGSASVDPTEYFRWNGSLFEKIPQAGNTASPCSPKAGQ